MKSKKTRISHLAVVAAIFLLGLCTACMDTGASSSAAPTDPRPSGTAARPADDAAQDIGADAAKAAALEHAGLAEDAVSGLQVERELDDGRLEYSVEFYAGGTEYDYEIAADDGRILSWDHDTDN